jgi:hypothetical protein
MTDQEHAEYIQDVLVAIAEGTRVAVLADDGTMRMAHPCHVESGGKYEGREYTPSQTQRRMQQERIKENGKWN